MKATVIFTVGDIEIKTTTTKIPTLSNIPESGKNNMVVLHAMSKIKKEIGLDLYAFDEDINEKATVIYEG